MKLKGYLKDKKFFIGFYIIEMLFIIGVICYDRANRLLPSNIRYIVIVSTILFVLYLILEYFIYNNYYKNISKLIDQENDNFADDLPLPVSYQQLITHNLFKKLNTRYNQQIARLEQDKKDYLEFITAWVHDIKVPIAAGRLVLENSEGKTLDDVIPSIEEELKRIEGHVEKVLYYSKADDFSNDYMLSDCKLQVLVNDVIKKHAVTFIGKKIGIHFENLEYEVSTDKKWMHFIIDQIITNSLKYTKDHGQIKVYAEKNDNETLLHIEDNGIGITKEDIGRIFQKGFTGYNGRNNEKSTGLGLYLGQKLAKKLGHHISIESQLMEYTRVTIHFPKWTDYFDVVCVKSDRHL